MHKTHAQPNALDKGWNALLVPQQGQTLHIRVPEKLLEKFPNCKMFCQETARTLNEQGFAFAFITGCMFRMSWFRKPEDLLALETPQGLCTNLNDWLDLISVVSRNPNVQVAGLGYGPARHLADAVFPKLMEPVMDTSSDTLKTYIRAATAFHRVGGITLGNLYRLLKALEPNLAKLVPDS